MRGKEGSVSSIVMSQLRKTRRLERKMVLEKNSVCVE